nr:MAG: replication initiator protein [Microviridae sp.]
MCLYPKLIKNRRYIPNKKNGGIIPPIIDNRVLAVPIGCGNCMECRKKKKREWQVRLHEELKHNKNGHYVTLTFSDDSIKQLCEKYKDIGNKKGYEKDNAIATKAIRLFTERWRKEHKKSVRHWLITELGHKNTERIHLHGIVFTDESKEEINKHWQYGWIWAGYNNQKTYISEKTVNYIIKYITKNDQDHKEYKPIILCSKGIGKKYTETENAIKNKYSENTKESYTTSTGHQIALPIYYRNKIYTEEEKEQLWIEKLDKKIRYINGQKIDISNGEEEYYKALKYAQQKNIALGYGTNEKNWQQQKYEQERRDWIHKKRT